MNQPADTSKKQYIATAPGGETLQGVKELYVWEAEYFAGLGYTMEEYDV